MRVALSFVALVVIGKEELHAFTPFLTTTNRQVSRHQQHTYTTNLQASQLVKEENSQHEDGALKAITEASTKFSNRRSFFGQVFSTGGAIAASGIFVSLQPEAANAEKTFTPGGTLVDREVGVKVGNSEASASRLFDNSNVLFSQDYYYKFGNAAPFIEPGTTEFPTSMPFTPSQQRYDALKKYGQRIKQGLQALNDLEGSIAAGDYRESLVGPSDPKYALRPMGLMANNFCASENTGTTNELFLARWYINEIYVQLLDVQTATNDKDALTAIQTAKKAANSYLSMINRVITSKVGDKFEYI